MLFTWEALIFLLLIIGLLYFNFERKDNYWLRRGVNGPKALPLIGNLLDNFRMPQNELEEYRFQKYGKIYGVMQGITPVLTIGDPEILKQIMITDFRIFMNHRVNFEGDPYLGQMLTELKDNDWRRVRAIMSPAFTILKLKAMQPLVEKCIQKSMDYLDSVEKRIEEIDTIMNTSAYTLDVLAACVFGANTNAIENPYDEFVVKALEMVNIPLWRILTTVTLRRSLQLKFDLQLLSKRHVQYFTTILRDIIRKRREMKTSNVDFLTLLLNSEYKEDKTDEKEKEVKADIKNVKVKLTEEDIIGNCILFFVAGFETTAAFLNFTLYALAMHPNVQQKLFEEIEQYFEDHETIEFDYLNALPYFEAVCNESLRLYTPVTNFEHICGENYKLGEITIEKGVIINLPLYAMHRDPELFPNPHQFIPERFLPENKKNIKPYSFIPFVHGPRICIGNRFSTFHSKQFIANLVKNFEIIKTRNTPDKPVYTGRFSFLTCKPIFVAIRRRNQTNEFEEKE